MSDRILCVDDDQNILQAYQRSLRKRFRIETALGGREALAKLDPKNPFAVIVSDMRMPEMDGVQFLATVSRNAPSTVRMMLTGNADQQTAIEAVNEGNIFRFLTKPCSPEDFAKALTAGIEQYRLVTAEKELLGKTLRGSIKVLNDVLALSNPTAFGHASRVRELVGRLCKELKVERTWEYEIAAMLSQIGCVTIPPDTLDKVYHRKKLAPDEAEMFASHPEIGRELVANIPRMDGVAKIIAYQQKAFDGTGFPVDDVVGTNIPQGARILKIALDFEAAKWGGLDDLDAVADLNRRTEEYDPQVFAAFERVVGIGGQLERKGITVRELAVGMYLGEHVRTAGGAIVVAKGQEVTPSLCVRVKNFARRSRIQEPIAVFVRIENPVPTLTGS